MKPRRTLNSPPPDKTPQAKLGCFILAAIGIAVFIAFRMIDQAYPSAAPDGSLRKIQNQIRQHESENASEIRGAQDAIEIRSQNR